MVCYKFVKKMDNNSIFIEKLRSSGLRPTKQRLEICKLLFNRKDTFHFSVKDLSKTFEKVCKKLCDENQEVIKMLENLEPKNDS